MTVDLLITGAGGWLGAALCDVLESVSMVAAQSSLCAVLGPDDDERVEQRWVELGAAVYRGDLQDRGFTGSLPQARHVIHAAAVIHPRNMFGFAMNEELTAAALRLATPGGVFTHVSSAAALGVGVLESFPTASVAAAPVGGYARSKLRCEQLVADAAHSGHVVAVVLRPFWFYGANPPQRQRRFGEMCRSGRFPLPSEQTRRSVSNVHELAFAALRSATLASRSAPSFFVADPRSYSYQELVAARRPDHYPRGLRVPVIVFAAFSVLDRVLQRLGRYSAPVHVLGEFHTSIAGLDDHVAQHRALLGLPLDVELAAGVAAEFASTPA
jgi:nucleoside-diphosphate-sugar epimerase